MRKGNKTSNKNEKTTSDGNLLRINYFYSHAKNARIFVEHM